MGRALHTLAERLGGARARPAGGDERRDLRGERLGAGADRAGGRVWTRSQPRSPSSARRRPRSASWSTSWRRRLARMEGERETVADLAALAETWAAELAALEARVDEGLSTLEEQAVAEVRGDGGAGWTSALAESLDELTHGSSRSSATATPSRDELTRTAASWAIERASLQERVAELAARIVTGPMPAASDGAGRAVRAVAAGARPPAHRRRGTADAARLPREDGRTISPARAGSSSASTS